MKNHSTRRNFLAATGTAALATAITTATPPKEPEVTHRCGFLASPAARARA